MYCIHNIKKNFHITNNFLLSKNLFFDKDADNSYAKEKKILKIYPPISRLKWLSW